LLTLLERVTGIEPALSAWEADVLPLNYTRRRTGDEHIRRRRPAHSTDAAADPTIGDRAHLNFLAARASSIVQ
jgi:hypothetical protein